MKNTKLRQLNKDYFEIERSGLFDEEYYSLTYKISGSTIEHYLAYEFNGLVRPNAKFDPVFFRNYYFRSIPLNMSPFAWFCQNRETWPLYSCEAEVEADARLLKDSGLFDHEFVRRTAAEGRPCIRPEIYYCTEGYRFLFSPSAAFDVRSYLYQNPDVAQTRSNPVLHYIGCGKPEGRRTFVVPESGSTPFMIDFSSLFEQNNREKIGLSLIHSNNGGLINRIGGLIAVIHAARQINATAYSWWTPSDECAARFCDLFSCTGVPIAFGDMYSPCLEAYPEVWSNENDQDELPNLDVSQKSRVTIVRAISPIRTTKGLAPAPAELAAIFRRLPYSDAVRSRLSILDDSLLRSTVGVHIRRPYKDPSYAALEHSKFDIEDARPLELVCGVASTYRGPVLLCTNDLGFEDKARKLYQNLIVNSKSDAENRNASSIIDALVDVIALSRCKFIISLQNTSFSYFASVVGSGGLAQLQKKSEPGKMLFHIFRHGIWIDEVLCPSTDLTGLFVTMNSMFPAEKEEALSNLKI